VLIGSTRGHVRQRQVLERRIEELARAVLAQIFEELVAEIVQPDIAIAIGILRSNLRQRLGNRLVRVIGA
jgi:hypothetical protein